MTPEERKRLNPVAVVLDALGIPTPDELIPMPADVASDLGIPTPRDLTRGMKSKLESVRPKIGGRF